MPSIYSNKKTIILSKQKNKRQNNTKNSTLIDIPDSQSWQYACLRNDPRVYGLPSLV